jgi:5-methylcytosine-specific restriction protein B
MEFSKEVIVKAINKIEADPSLMKGRNSSTYDLIYKDKQYPPILVLSEANKINGGKELKLEDFNNSVEIPFSILKHHGFDVVEKVKGVNFWIEKTITKKRIDRLEGERALGKALWSPERDQRGADIYRNMTLVKKGDYVLHLIDNSSISGVSIVKEKAIKTKGISGTDWDGPSYLITLENYTPFKTPLSRTDILKESNKNILENISKISEVFYNKKLDLRQGAYLTPCPIELLELINNEYFNINSANIPLINLKSKILIKRMDKFQYKSFHKKTEEAGLIFSEKMVARFVASLCTKPFVICSGLSGSGKTKLAQAFVQWICESEEQYKIIPVGADWTNREPLLGYPNAIETDKYVIPENGALELITKASLDDKKPYFLILDEMNLSHVERYFADFLSAMESGEAIPLHTIEDHEYVPNNIVLPKNLFIIGTVNIDETTYMFSPKVLDRANTIEFRVNEEDLTTYFDSKIKLDMDLLKSYGTSMAENFVDIATDESNKDFDKIKVELLYFFTELKKSGAEFGYRTAFEIGRLIQKLEELGEKGDDLLDIAIMQKLLPKLHGSRSKLSKILITLGNLCLNDSIDSKTKYFDQLNDIDFTESNIKYKLSFEKIVRMYKNALDNGFTSYAEA